jgi:hypothetical protein
VLGGGAPYLHAALMLLQSTSFSMNAICRSAVQPSWRGRTGTGVKEARGLCSDIVPPGEKEAKQLFHLGGCRTGFSNGSFGWKADLSGSLRLRQNEDWRLNVTKD